MNGQKNLLLLIARTFASLVQTAFILMGLWALLIATVAAAAPIRVLVWDERQEDQKSAYGDYLGNNLAKHLAEQKDFSVKSVGLNDPDQGLTEDNLDHCDVLIWWGHKRHGEVTPEHLAAIMKRLKAGRLSLIALHSAHWSKPFIAAMDERALEDAIKLAPKSERNGIIIEKIPPPPGLAKRGSPLPAAQFLQGTNGTNVLKVEMPSCVFPFVDNAGQPSHLTTLLKNHPIAKGIPATFDLPKTEIYGGPFYVPKPDAQIFYEQWDNGESFPCGSVWPVGKGKVFYFRPGHETYPIYNQPIPLQIIENAIRWADPKKK